VTCLSQSVADILPWRPEFYLRPVKFLVHEVALAQLILRVPRFIPVGINQSVLHIDISFIYRPRCIILAVDSVAE